jgi:hypothetical protein
MECPDHNQVGLVSNPVLLRGSGTGGNREYDCGEDYPRPIS